MKKLIALLVIASLGLFTLGCGGETKAPAGKGGDSKPTDTAGDAGKTEEGGAMEGEAPEGTTPEATTPEDDAPKVEKPEDDKPAEDAPKKEDGDE